MFECKYTAGDHRRNRRGQANGCPSGFAGVAAKLCVKSRYDIDRVDAPFDFGEQIDRC